MNSYAKTKALVLTLVIVLLVQQSESSMHHLSMTNCGPGAWHIYNGMVTWIGHGLNIVADIAYGDEPYIVEQANISVPFCPDFFPCRLNTTQGNFTKLFCERAMDDPVANRSCELMERVISMHVPGFELPYCEDLVSCVRDNTYVILKNVTCDSPNLDPFSNATCNAIQIIVNSWPDIQLISQHFGTNNTALCWTYESLEMQYGSYSRSEVPFSDSSDYSSDSSDSSSDFSLF